MRVLMLCLWLVSTADAFAQQPAGSSAGEARTDTPPVRVEELPISVERIQQELERAPALDTVPSRPIFRLEVFGDRTRLLDPIEWLPPEQRAIRSNGPLWHDEYLAMVTPPQARLYGAFSPGELAQVTATSLVQALATRGIVGAVKSALRDRRQREAEAEVDAAIAAWKAARDAANGKTSADAPRDEVERIADAPPPP